MGAAEEQLKELGEKLEAAPPDPADDLAKLLEVRTCYCSLGGWFCGGLTFCTEEEKNLIFGHQFKVQDFRRVNQQAAECLHGVEQSPGPSVMETIQPCLKAVARDEFLKHHDEDVKVLLATCFCEITRITAPEAPYSDDVLRDMFHLIVDTFSGLNDVNGKSFGRRVAILETVARYRACVVMLDLECNDLIADMFRSFLEIISDNHEPNIVNSMQSVMALIIDESEDIEESLLNVLLSTLGRKKTGVSLPARKLARHVIEHSAGKLEPYIRKILTSSLDGDGTSTNNSIDHHEVIFDLYQCAPKVLKVVVPYITGELLADEVETRSKAVEILGELFSLPGIPILESFKSLFDEFLKRLTDRAVEIRVSVIEHLKKCLMSNHSRPEAQEIIKALCDRLLDYEENVSVKCYTMERLADIYKFYCQSGSDSSVNSDDFEWIPGKILRCLYDKDFRPESIESILCGSLFPPEYPTKERVKHWVTAVTHFDKVEMKALEQIFLQKQRLQQEMLKYMSLRQTSQVDLLTKLGEKHALHDFVSTLSMRCSYLLVNKEYVKEILSEASDQKSTGNTKLMSSCMDLLTAVSSFFPSLLSGLEEDIIELLKEDNELLKEGIAHVLSKAGGNIREQLASSSSITLLLERLCLEGTRKQAKYSVHALAAITKDDGLMSLSVLYKRLVDLLEEKKVHLPSILQSLGCIAQIAMPIFETRGEEIINFITKKILDCNDDSGDVSAHKSEWSDSTQSCLLKIYGIKTLVKSCQPCKDAQAHPGIEKLMGILKNILTYGDISANMISSTIDKAHLRLAAAKAVLRLSRQWDHKVPVDVFYLTLRISQIYGFFYYQDDVPQFKHNIIEVAQICQQVKMRQLSVQAETNVLTAYPEYMISYLVHALSHDPSCPNIEEHEDVEAFGPIYWRLHLLLLILLGEEGLQHSVPGMKKESFTTIVSIFKSIKYSQDVVDVNKTKTLHAICDLGILIGKKLCQEQINISEAQTVSLPSQLYAPVQKDQNENSVESDEQIWPGCENVLAHFEALMTAKSAEVESPKDKMLIDETDEFGNEVPLGKIVKILKSQGAKKAGRKQKTKSGSINMEKDDDVLGLVREINLDNQENLGESEKSKPKKKRMDAKESNDKPVDFSTPKRKRSVSKSRPHSTKGNKNSDELLLQSVDPDETINSFENKVEGAKKRDDSVDTELVTSPASVKTPVSKGKKGAKKPHAEILSSSPKKSDEAGSSKRTVDSGSLNGSIKRQKPKLVSGLAKVVSIVFFCSCTTHDTGSEDLIGKRIKVWWPLDKKFYEGVVESFDSSKRRHTVLYDDGDVEVLNLAKEKWEIVASDDPPVKARKKDHSGRNQGRAQDKSITSSKQTPPPEQEKSKKRPSPPKRKGKPKGLPKNKRRKIGGKSSVDAAGDANIDSDSSSSLAHSDSDNDKKSDGRNEKEVVVAKKAKAEKVSGKGDEPKEEEPDDHNLNSKEESDNETLSVWKKRTAKAT
uniref:AF-4 domain containing protein-like protein n=2 Tax=Oryza sativa TaxID=4530 RepID=A1XFD1_ORYSI|nr:AF-4 domain containing protein-like protein [Oryza sativa Indica Group]